MRFKKIALALFACLALGAFAANAAQAAQWTVGTTENQTTAGTTLTKEGVTCRKHGTSDLIFHSELLGLPVELTANQIDCVEAFVDTVATDAEAHSEGFLTFTEVKVLKPSTACKVGNVGSPESGEVTTTKLTDKVDMDTKVVGSTTVFDTFFPEVAPNFVVIEFGGASCPLAGASAPVKGTACGEAVHTNAGGTGYEPNKTGTLTKVQTLLFGAAQQETGGCALTLGTKAAQITGAVDNELSGGPNAGKPWGAD